MAALDALALPGTAPAERSSHVVGESIHGTASDRVLGLGRIWRTVRARPLRVFEVADRPIGRARRARRRRFPAAAGNESGAGVREEPFRVWIAVRGYELDAHGHVNRTVYLQYAEHARWEYVRAAGIEHNALYATGIGLVTLEETIRYHRELRAGDELAVSCAYVWGEGKTFRAEQKFRLGDGTLVADLRSVCGLLDLKSRRLVSQPAARWRSLTKTAT
jgi:acyl-CoA thioester hydrolase